MYNHHINNNKDNTPMRGSFEEELSVITERTKTESREKRERADRIFRNKRMFWQKMLKCLY